MKLFHQINEAFVIKNLKPFNLFTKYDVRFVSPLITRFYITPRNFDSLTAANLK